MSIRFNPPPAWRAYLPEDFVPAAEWIPERAWGAPPIGWPMWVESATGMAAEPPVQYRANPYLYMSVMPDWDAPETSQGSTAAMVSGQQPTKRALSRGKKIGLGVVAGVLAIGVIGALGGGDDKQPAPVAASPSPSAVEAIATLEPTAEPTTVSSASAEAEASAKVAAEEQEKKDAAEASAKAEAEAKEKAEADKKAKVEAEKKAKAEAAAQAEAEKEAGTLSQQNALSKASDYLDYTAFSKTGLIKQLEYEGYSNSDAKWAVERVTVDWNEQAALKAADYLDYTSFSKSGLIDQLIYEGYTKKQATYGVSTTGL